MKRFKSKKRKKKKIIIYIFIFLFFFSYIYTIKYLSKNRLHKSILNSATNYINFDIRKYTKNKISNIVNNPDKLLTIRIVKTTSKNISSKKNNIKKLLNEEKIKKANINKEPILYIYNTHQTEEYVDYNVQLASNLLVNKLNNSGYSTIYEEASMKVFLETNNLKYNKSYVASRNYLNTAINNNPSLKYFFDIHRDSIGKDKTTTNFNNKNYARILFVVGDDNSSKSGNLNNANKLNSIINSKIPSISRGVVLHGGKSYNGVYNQDISDNVFLIEIGGKDNNKEEVENTIEVLYESIIEYIGGIV